jgi:hypothetical protein
MWEKSHLRIQIRPPFEQGQTSKLYKSSVCQTRSSGSGKRNEPNLTPSHQAMLFNVLTANNKVFKGRQGYYTGALVGLKLKDMQNGFTPTRTPTHSRIAKSWSTSLFGNAQSEPFIISLQRSLRNANGYFQCLAHPKRMGQSNLLLTSVVST